MVVRQIGNRREDIHAGQLVFAKARVFSLVPRHRSAAVCAFRLACAEQNYRSAVVAESVFDIFVRRVDFHSFGTPAKKTVGRRIAFADEIYPKSVGENGRNFDDFYWEIIAFARASDFVERVVNPAHDRRIFNQRVVAENVSFFVQSYVFFLQFEQRVKG